MTRSSSSITVLSLAPVSSSWISLLSASSAPAYATLHTASPPFITSSPPSPSALRNSIISGLISTCGIPARNSSLYLLYIDPLTDSTLNSGSKASPSSSSRKSAFPSGPRPQNLVSAAALCSLVSMYADCSPASAPTDQSSSSGSSSSPACTACSSTKNVSLYPSLS